MYLEDGEWSNAREYCERVLDIDPENAQAYLGKLMADMNIRIRDRLSLCQKSFAQNSNYLKIVKFGDASLKQELSECIKIIEDRRELERRAALYREACDLMKQNTPDAYLKAKRLFQSIKTHRDSVQKAAECTEKAESARKNTIYNQAVALMNGDDEASCLSAIEQFEMIMEWRDAKQKIEQCKKKIEEIRTAEEEARISALKKREEDRILEEKKEIMKKRKVRIALSIVSAIVILAVVLLIILSNQKLEKTHQALIGETFEGTYTYYGSYHDTIQNITLVIVDEEYCNLYVEERSDGQKTNNEYTNIRYDLSGWIFGIHLSWDHTQTGYGLVEPFEVIVKEDYIRLSTPNWNSHESVSLTN